MVPSFVKVGSRKIWHQNCTTWQSAPLAGPYLWWPKPSVWIWTWNRSTKNIWEARKCWRLLEFVGFVSVDQSFLFATAKSSAYGPHFGRSRWGLYHLGQPRNRHLSGRTVRLWWFPLSEKWRQEMRHHQSTVAVWQLVVWQMQGCVCKYSPYIWVPLFQLYSPKYNIEELNYRVSVFQAPPLFEKILTELCFVAFQLTCLWIWQLWVTLDSFSHCISRFSYFIYQFWQLLHQILTVSGSKWQVLVATSTIVSKFDNIWISLLNSFIATASLDFYTFICQFW